MHERIAITGSRGTIGSFLTPELSKDYQITELELPKTDVRDFTEVLEKFDGVTQVIHLAWNSETESFQNGEIDPDNKLMAVNIFNASQEVGAKRVIIASSVHADTFYGWETPPYLTFDHVPEPDSPYGEDKVEIENLGREFAKKGLEVVCIRFGGVNPQDEAAGRGYPREERASYLSHKDLIGLIKKIISIEEIPGNYVLMNAVSDNEGRVHDISNPFGWDPAGGVEKLRNQGQDF